MTPLSATDAISPAWDHTQRLLLTHRNWRTVLKIGTVAVFAEISGCNTGFNNMRHTPAAHSGAMAAMMAFALIIGLVALVIGLIVFYVSSRFQFVLFDLVLRSDTTVAPSWRRFGSVTWRWIGLKLLFLLAAIICAAPLVVPVILSFIRAARASGTEGELANPVAFVFSMLGFIVALFFVALIVAFFYIMLRDFGLPSMALEDASIGVTVSRVIRFVRDEPGQVILYAILLLLMRIAGAIVAYFVLAILALIAFIPLGGGGLIFWLALRHDGIGAHVVMIVGWVVLGLILAAVTIVAGIMLFGYLFTFFQAYALYFLGGRYPMLGAWLERPPASPDNVAQPQV